MKRLDHSLRKKYMDLALEHDLIHLPQNSGRVRHKPNSTYQIVKECLYKIFGRINPTRKAFFGEPQKILIRMCDG